MATEFAQHAVSDGATQLTTEQRMTLSLVNPNHPLALPAGKVGTITKNRVRYMLAELVAMNMPKINQWLDDLAKEHPRAAIDALIELAKFTTPQQKAVSVDVRENGGNVRSYSVTQLEQMMRESNVVSDQ